LTPFDPAPLRTQRLVLRWISQADLDALYAIFSNPEVMRYWSTPPFTQREEIEAKVRQAIDGYESGRSLSLAIEREADGALVGNCTLYAFHEASRRAEMGYCLGRPYWGQGYMHEALTALVDHAFRTLALNRLEADIDPRNLPSAKSLERLGFVREGFLRERWIVDGEVSDTALYGLLHREWKKKDLTPFSVGA
jgi:[ribosomal protein S5]-alanine N-acetyltransferase